MPQFRSSQCLALIVVLLGMTAAAAPPDPVAVSRDLRSAGRTAEAIAHLEKALAGPQLPSEARDRALLAVSELYAETGRIEDALRVGEALAARRPDDPVIQLRMVTLLMAAKRPDDAAPILERVARLEPGNKEHWRTLATLYESRGRLEEAAGALDRVARGAEPSTDAAVWTHLGELREQTGHAHDAAKAYEQALLLVPRDAELCRRLGRLYIQLDREADAVRALERALTLEPKHKDTMRRLADAYGWTDRETDRARMLDELLAMDARDDATRESLARTLLELGREREAAGHYEVLVTADPANRERRLRLAELYEAMDRSDAAITHLEIVVADDPTEIVAKAQLASLYRRSGYALRATQLYREIVADDPTYEIARAELSELELGLRPRLSPSYDLYHNRTGTFRHAAGLLFEHWPLDTLGYRVGYHFGHVVGVNDRGLATTEERFQLNGFTAGLSAWAGLRVRFDLDLDVDAYFAPETRSFLGGRFLTYVKLAPQQTLELSFRRHELYELIEALSAQALAHDVRLDWRAEFFGRWLVHVGGGYGHYMHTDVGTSTDVNNHMGTWELETGVNLVERPVAVDLLVNYTGDAFKKVDGRDGDFPYFSPALYQTLGLVLDVYQRPAWWFRWELFAKPMWAIDDAAMLIDYGVKLEFKPHQKHIISLAYERTDTLYGTPTVFFNQDVFRGVYSWIF